MTGVPHAHPLPPEAERRVRGLLDGSLSDAERQAAMEHLRTCTACREVYDRVATAERAVAGGDGVLGVPALERVAARLQSEIAPAPRRAWLWWAAAAATAASVFLFAVRVARTPSDDGFTVRGGSMEDGVGIRVFRIAASGVSELKDGETAEVGDELGVSVTTGPYGNVDIALRTPQSDASLAETKAVVKRGVIDEPLDWTARVDAAYLDAGTLTVEAHFSEPSTSKAPDVAYRMLHVRVTKAAEVP